jgi:RNA polymerase sigma factor (sigma-70 family)
VSALPRHAESVRTDADLLATIAAGNLEALGELFDRYEPDVRRYVARLGMTRSDVDDLVQSTFLEVMRAAERFDPKLPARSWLLGIATVMVRRHRRSLGRSLARLLTWTNAPRAPGPARPDELYECDESTLRLQAAFARLSTKKREVFVLCTFEGLSGPEVARALDIPVNTVWTRLHHARQELFAAVDETERKR